MESILEKRNNCDQLNLALNAVMRDCQIAAVSYLQPQPSEPFSHFKRNWISVLQSFSEFMEILSEEFSRDLSILKNKFLSLKKIANEMHEGNYGVKLANISKGLGEVVIIYQNYSG